MAEPKPFASLTSGLLARKGGAKPAMRRQVGMFGSLQNGFQPQDDLGWNDMGEEHVSDSGSAAAGLTPMPQAHVAPVLAQPEPQPEVAAEAPVPPVPPVLEQRRVLAEKVASPVEAQPVAPTKPVVTKKPRASKAAFTLRVDPERHLRLRLACAIHNRSAQQIVTEAVDAFLRGRPEIDALAEQLAPAGAAKK